MKTHLEKGGDVIETPFGHKVRVGGIRPPTNTGKKAGVLIKNKYRHEKRI